MSKHEERLGCIFTRKNNSLIPEAFVLIDYYANNKYRIKNGKYINLTGDFFLNLEGNPNFINDEEIELKTKNFRSKKNYMYIFDNNFILRTMREENIDDVYNAYISIIRKLKSTKLIPSGINALSNNVKFVATTEVDRTEVFSNFDILNELYDDEIPEDALEMVEDAETQIFAITQQDILDFIAQRYQEEKEKETEAEEIEYESIDDVIKDISKKIIGQEEAIKTLVSNIYYNQLLIDELDNEEIFDQTELDSRKITILLDGSTGTGKTAIAKEVANHFDIPIVISNANSFSETGYVGPTITDLLKKLLEQADGDIEKAERGIIVLDEIDKIAESKKEYGRSMKKGVQEELLSFIGGGIYNLNANNPFVKSTTFDTSKITFILMGAFTDIRDKKIKENESNKIGFGETKTHDKTYTITPEDYIEYGLMREFFGRIKVLASTKTYTKQDLTNILLNSMISPLKNFEKTAKMFGYDGITYNEEFITKIVDEAYKMNTGARSLQTIISGIQNDLLLDLINGKFENNKVEINEENLKQYKIGQIRKYD